MLGEAAALQVKMLKFREAYEKLSKSHLAFKVQLLYLLSRQVCFYLNLHFGTLWLHIGRQQDVPDIQRHTHAPQDVFLATKVCS